MSELSSFRGVPSGSPFTFRSNSFEDNLRPTIEVNSNNKQRVLSELKNYGIYNFYSTLENLLDKKLLKGEIKEDEKENIEIYAINELIAINQMQNLTDGEKASMFFRNIANKHKSLLDESTLAILSEEDIEGEEKESILT